MCPGFGSSSIFLPLPRPSRGKRFISPAFLHIEVDTRSFSFFGRHPASILLFSLLFVRSGAFPDSDPRCALCVSLEPPSRSRCCWRLFVRMRAMRKHYTRDVSSRLRDELFHREKREGSCSNFPFVSGCVSSSRDLYTHRACQFSMFKLVVGPSN